MKAFDFIIIGSGPAGQRASIQAAKAGKRVALIEKEPVFGGACIHTGTLPSKALRESIYDIYNFRRGSAELTRTAVKKKVTVGELLKRKENVVNNENEIISHQVRGNGISVYTGLASFIDSNHLKITTSEGGETVVEGKYFVIATGSKPVRPANIPFDDHLINDSDTILKMKAVPDSMIVIGGGVIGCEYASMFSALGIEVHLVDKKSDILPFVDQEITEVLKKALISQGCRLHLGDAFEKITKLPNGVETKLGSGKVIKTDSLLYCMGRGAQTEALNLGAVGVPTDERGHIEVDVHYRTKAQNIYAVGDVIGFPSLASSSFEQGRLAVCHALGIATAGFPEQFPYGIYTIPEISQVGKSEEQLQKEGIDFEVGRAEYHETARGQILADSQGLLKMCFCPETTKIYGISIIGNSAAELIHLGQMIMTLGGDLKTLVGNIFNYPTLAEAYKIAAFNGLNKLSKRK